MASALRGFRGDLEVLREGGALDQERMVPTVEESRTTWLLLGLVALAGRLAVEQPEELAACFSGGRQTGAPAIAQRPCRETAGPG